jgi:hypothetical protein
LPALARVAETIRQHAPGRNVEAFGLPTLPAALAFGCAFLSTNGLRVSWPRSRRDVPTSFGRFLESRQDSGFQAQIVSKNPAGRDLAVLVSVADNAEPVFTAFQKELPPLRALVHITKSRPPDLRLAA